MPKHGNAKHCFPAGIVMRNAIGIVCMLLAISCSSQQIDYNYATGSGDTAQLFAGKTQTNMTRLFTSITNMTPTGQLWVAQNGSDTTGARNRRDKPFATLTAAFAAKESGDMILMGPGTFDFTVTDTAGSTATSNRLVSNFSVVGCGKGVTTINVIPRGTNEHNRVLSVPNATSVTNVAFRGWKIDGNVSDYAWASGGKLDWILQGQNITLDDIEVVDFGGNSGQESFTPLFQSSTNFTVMNSLFHNPGSAYISGPTFQDSSRGVIRDNVVEGYNVAFGMVGNSSFNVVRDNQTTNIVTASVLCDTAGTGEVWGNQWRDNRFHGSGDAILIGRGAHLDMRITGNSFFGGPRGITLTNYNGSATNYFLRPFITGNDFYLSGGRNITAVSTTNAFIALTVGRSTADNLVSGADNFGHGNMMRTGAAYTDLPNAVTALTVAASTSLTVGTGISMDENSIDVGASSTITNVLVQVPSGTITLQSDAMTFDGTVTFTDGDPVFDGYLSGTPSDAVNAWFWLPVVVNGTNAFVRIHR